MDLFRLTFETPVASLSDAPRPHDVCLLVSMPLCGTSHIQSWLVCMANRLWQGWFPRLGHKGKWSFHMFSYIILSGRSHDKDMKAHSRSPTERPMWRDLLPMPAPARQLCEGASWEMAPPTPAKPSDNCSPRPHTIWMNLMEPLSQNCQAKLVQNSWSSETINKLCCYFKALSFVVICYRTIDS